MAAARQNEMNDRRTVVATTTRAGRIDAGAGLSLRVGAAPFASPACSVGIKTF